MGKASILVIPVTIVVLGLIIWGIIWMVNRADLPKSVRQKAELADEAFDMIKDVLVPRNIDNMDILTPESSQKFKSWAARYRKVNS